MTERPSPVGHRVFGEDATAYHQFRPGYPDAVYDVLRDRCGLRPGIAAFEIGPGTGQATRILLGLGVNPLVAIEPDERLADVLAADAERDGRTAALHIQTTGFEDAELIDGTFDLGVSATSFHWLEQVPALTRVGRALRPGGWWAMWWNMFGDPGGNDPFHLATRHLLEGPGIPPTLSDGPRPFPLDADGRRVDLLVTGLFDKAGFEVIRWTKGFDATATAGLYRTFSGIASRPAAERERIIAELARITDEQFGGLVERDVLTPIHTARRV